MLSVSPVPEVMTMFPVDASPLAGALTSPVTSDLLATMEPFAMTVMLPLACVAAPVDTGPLIFTDPAVLFSAMEPEVAFSTWPVATEPSTVMFPRASRETLPAPAVVTFPAATVRFPPFSTMLRPPLPALLPVTTRPLDRLFTTLILPLAVLITLRFDTTVPSALLSPMPTFAVMLSVCAVTLTFEPPAPRTAPLGASMVTILPAAVRLPAALLKSMLPFALLSVVFVPLVSAPLKVMLPLVVSVSIPALTFVVLPAPTTVMLPASGEPIVNPPVPTIWPSSVAFSPSTPAASVAFTPSSIAVPLVLWTSVIRPPVMTSPPIDMLSAIRLTLPVPVPFPT